MTLEVGGGGGGWGRLGQVDATSDFVYTVMIGAVGARSSFATCGSGGAGYSASGCRYAMTSASAIARSAAARIVSCSLYSGSSSPGESVKMNCVSSRVSRPTTGRRVRSEEHTSELQSRLHLVCRLLLEKKKKAPMMSLADG